MRDVPAHTPALCSRFHRASELIGRRWTGAIIFILLKSRCRFATLRDAIPDITDRMLCDRLQALEREGIVERTVVPKTPVRVEYALTKKGRALASAINAIPTGRTSGSNWMRRSKGTGTPRAYPAAPEPRTLIADPAKNHRCKLERWLALVFTEACDLGAAVV